MSGTKELTDFLFLGKLLIQRNYHLILASFGEITAIIVFESENTVRNVLIVVWTKMKNKLEHSMLLICKYFVSALHSINCFWCLNMNYGYVIQFDSLAASCKGLYSVLKLICLHSAVASANALCSVLNTHYRYWSNVICEFGCDEEWNWNLLNS